MVSTELDWNTLSKTQSQAGCLWLASFLRMREFLRILQQNLLLILDTYLLLTASNLPCSCQGSAGLFEGKKSLLVPARFLPCIFRRDTASILPYSCPNFLEGEEIPPCSCQFPPASKGRNREDFLARVRSSLPRWGFCCFLREGEEILPLNAGLSSWGFQAGKKSPAFCVSWGIIAGAEAEKSPCFPALDPARNPLD